MIVAVLKAVADIESKVHLWNHGNQPPKII
jgi:hypothetical protein